MFAHPLVDTRACVGHFPDPLFGVIPEDQRFTFVTRGLYYVFNIVGPIGLIIWAARGDQAPLLRFMGALALQGLFRSTTLILVPLCQVHVTPGVPVLAAFPTLDVGFMTFPWRAWAVNDLFYSGHVGEFLLMHRAVAWGPWPLRLLLYVFHPIQAYALMATREHYSLDILAAVPFAFLADALSVRALAHFGVGRSPQGSA